MKLFAILWVIFIFPAMLAGQSTKQFSAYELKTCCDASARVERAANSNDPKLFQEGDMGPAGFCMGYVSGVGETLFRAGIIKPTPTETGSTALVPLQAVHIFMKYLASHPEREHEAAPIVIKDALIDSKIWQAGL